MAVLIRFMPSVVVHQEEKLAERKGCSKMRGRVKGMLAAWRRRHGRKLAWLHSWNGWLVLLLALSGLMLLGGWWRGVLGEGRVWLKGAHIGLGLALLLPITGYILLLPKHWRQLRGKPGQRANVALVLALLAGWIGSGLALWAHRLLGPGWANPALLVHDALTWIGLPYIAYHSITRLKWLKEPARRTVKPPESSSAGRGGLHPAAAPSPLLTRRAFLRAAIGAGLAVAAGPSFLQWAGRALGSMGGSSAGELARQDGNRLLPAPEPQPGSIPLPGGGAKGTFRVYTVTPLPTFTNADWSFRIDGLVDRPESWTWEQFVRLPRDVQVSDFHCVTGWSVYSNTWEGIPLRRLLEQAGVRSGARTVKLYSGDGVYADSLTLEQAMEEDVLVAVLHDGQAIPSPLGGPVRLVVPRMYAYKSVKWLSRIELISGEHTGYWEERGYSKDAWV